jgi:predicted MFS family arabinose efflux permease
VIYFLYRWKRRTEAPETSSQRFRAAMGDGIRYMRSTPAVQWVLLRTMFFSFCASAIWALLPLIALPFGSVGYGLLLGWFGTGAVAAAGILARLRRKVAVETLVAGGILLFSVVTLAAAAFSNFVLLCASLAAGGAAWITILSSLNLTVQTTAPAALRARALSMYLLVLQGGLAAGSAVWGVIAAEFSLGAALGIAAAGLITGLLAVGRFPSERRLEVSTPATS